MVNESIYRRYRETEYSPQDGYNYIRYEIIIQAIRDYVWARDYVSLKKEEYVELCDQYPIKSKAPVKVKSWFYRYSQAENMIVECESFFRGSWFRELTPSLDGEVIIKNLRRMKYDQLKEVIKREGGTR